MSTALTKTIALNSFEPFKVLSEGLHLAIGVFDGIHVGHQAILKAAIGKAEACHETAGVLTFDPHPTHILNPDSPSPLILPLDVRLSRLSGFGIKWIFKVQFTQELAEISAEEFVHLLRRCFPTLKGVYVGENFRFGYHRLGDAKMLETLCGRLNITANILAKREYNHERISSSRIRRSLQDGNMLETNAMLGYNYYIEAFSEFGKQRGSSLGFPTLNFGWNPELRPRFGVYLAQLTVVDENIKPFLGVANYGLRPTFADLSSPVLEVHVLKEWPVELSTKKMKIEWVRFLRAEKRFDSINELKVQISKDISNAREVIKREAAVPLGYV